MAKLFKKEKKKDEKEGQTKKCDVIIHHTDNNELEIISNTKIEIIESLPYSSRVIIDGDEKIIKGSVESTIIEKEFIGQSYIGWFAALLLFVFFDIYRMLHELLNVTWSVGLADAIFLICFSIPVFGWSISLSQKTYKEMNLIFNPLTNLYYSYSSMTLEQAQNSSIIELWVTLRKQQRAFAAVKNLAWLSFKIGDLADELEKHEIIPSKIKIAWKGVDDIININEPITEELPVFDYSERELERKESLGKLQEMIEVEES